MIGTITILTGSVLLVLSAAISFVRALLALRAKGRFRQLLRNQMKHDAALRLVRMEMANDKAIPREHLQKAIKRMEANVALLDATDRRLLEPGLSYNTVTGSERFLREMLVN
jgi:hypothetical protein